MDGCSMCGSPVPDGQGGLCSMCYGDVGYGSDGYYEEFMRQAEHEPDQQEVESP